MCTVMEWFVPHGLAGAAQLRAFINLLLCCKWILLAGKTKITMAAARFNNLVDPCSLSVAEICFGESTGVQTVVSTHCTVHCTVKVHMISCFARDAGRRKTCKSRN